MEITTRTVGKCKVLDCSGPITLGPATATLREAIREAVLNDTTKVILNLGNVGYIDSAALGEIISGYVHVKNTGGNIVLLNLDPNVHRLMVIAKLQVILDIFDDEQKALEGCE